MMRKASGQFLDHGQAERSPAKRDRGRGAHLVRRRADLHRNHSHALDLASRVSAPGASRRADLPHRSRRTLGRGARRDRGVRADRGPLLAARVAARPRAPKPGK